MRHCTLLVVVLSALISCDFKSKIAADSENEEPINNRDEIIDTLMTDNKKYVNFYRPVGAFPVDLDGDDFIDTIKWDQLMFQYIETDEANYDMGRRIHVINRTGELVHAGDWQFVSNELIKFQDTSYRLDDKSILLSKSNSKTTCLILPHQLYASDVDAYTVIRVSSDSKPAVVFDEEFILTSIEDLDHDGFRELIGRHPNYGTPEYANCFVPFQVLKYSDSLTIDTQLTFDYNLPYKKYREYPEGSIRPLTKNDLLKYSNDQLKMMRNEIFADYGYVFESTDLNNYFSGKEWYKPIPDRAIIMTDWEKQNIELIKLQEKK